MKRLVSREQSAAIADYAAIALAAILPWSTSGTAIAAVVFIIAALGAIEWKRIGDVIRRPAAYVPVLFFALFFLGMFWAFGLPWKERLHGLEPAARLLVIPLLLYHFKHSTRGLWVAYAFFWSCAVLLALSWIFWAFQIEGRALIVGVPVKNYIDQGQEFSLCIAGALWWLVAALRKRQWGRVSILSAFIALFVLNMAFVVSSRTAFAAVPFLIVLFAVLNLRLRHAALICLVLVACVGALWVSSPYLRDRVAGVAHEVDVYMQNCAVTSSMGERLEFWRRAINQIREAPLLGRGTGTVHMLFKTSAEEALNPLPHMRAHIEPNRDLWSRMASNYAGQAPGNPHQQTLSVGMQLGLAGIVLLFFLWAVHLKLFWPVGGTAAWLGFATVAQNVFTSLANSHLFDFTPGWMYVIGVGVAGGMVLQQGKSHPRTRAE